MTCRVPFFLLASLAIALASASLHAEPEVKSSWWQKIPLIGRLIDREGDVKKASMPRLRLAEFTGGTGASAKTGLQDELLASREFFVATGEETADFTLNGSSIGGRVNGRLLDKKGKQLFERSYAAPGLDENIKALADDVIYTITGKPGLATSRIVFVSDKSGRKQVYVCDSDAVRCNRSRMTATPPSHPRSRRMPP